MISKKVAVEQFVAQLAPIHDYVIGFSKFEKLLKTLERSLNFTWQPEDDIAAEGSAFSLACLDGFRTQLTHSNYLFLGLTQGVSNTLVLTGGKENACSTLLWNKKRWPKFHWEVNPQSTSCSTPNDTNLGDTNPGGTNSGVTSLPVERIQQTLKRKLGYWSLDTLHQWTVNHKHWRVLDKRQKTVVRMHSYTMRLNNDQNTEFVYIVLEPIRGFEQEIRKVSERVRALASGQQSIIDGLKHAFIAEPEPTPAATPSLNCHDDAYMASCRLMQAALDKMRLHAPGLIQDIDTEFLHQYRVNLRKTRSLLKECKVLFVDDDLERFKRLFKHLSTLSTPVRDYDVHLIMIDKWIRDNQNNGLANEMLPLYQLISRKRRRSLKILIDYLHTDDYHNDLEAWEQFLADGVKKGKKAAGESIGDFASKRIRRCYRQLLKGGHKLNTQSPDEAFHDLRLDFKRLRYLLEYFLPIFPQKQFKVIFKQTKKVQSVLGDFQDITVQKAALMKYADELQNNKRIGAKTYLCLGYLLQEMGGHHDELREAFHEMFYRLDNEENESYIMMLGKSDANTSNREVKS